MSGAAVAATMAGPMSLNVVSNGCRWGRQAGRSRAAGGGGVRGRRRDGPITRPDAGTGPNPGVLYPL